MMTIYSSIVCFLLRNSLGKFEAELIRFKGSLIFCFVERFSKITVNVLFYLEVAID